MSGTTRTRPSLMTCGWCEQGRHAFHELEWCACCQSGHRPSLELARKLATARYPELANGTKAALEPLAEAIRTEYAQPSEPLACGYCCGAGPLCGSADPDHDEMGCEACAAVPLADPHPECLAMVDDYMEGVRRGDL